LTVTKGGNKMKLTLERFADDMPRMYPQLAENKIFKKFSLLAHTQAAKQFGIELEMLMVDYERYILEVSGLKQKVETVIPTATAAQMVTEMAKLTPAKTVAEAITQIAKATVPPGPKVAKTPPDKEQAPRSISVEKLAEQLKK
jgi:hypothetical protein